MSRLQPLTLEVFRKEFDAEVKTLGLKWEVVGFYAPDKRVYPFGTDTKVISTVFEALASSLISDIAARYGYEVEGSKQTVYPDFTLSRKGESTGRIAIDIKTTYRKFTVRGSVASFRYTLGSYGSFLRSGGKSIAHPYEQYSDHWVLGFLYTRRDGVTSKVYCRPEDVTEMLCPYKDVEYFLQHKHKVVGETAGSGNTKNIGSFPTTTIVDLREGRGPFAKHGKEICDEYWSKYENSPQGRRKSFSNLGEFLVWREKVPPQ